MPRTRMTARGRRPLLILGVIGVLMLAACGGAASQAPTSGSDGSTGQGDTPTATPAPTVGTDGSIVPGDGGTAFASATTALDALDSYAFRVEIASTSIEGDATTFSRTLMSGVVVNRPEKASSLEQSDLDKDGNVTSSSGTIVIGADAWIRSDPAGPWTAIPAAQADIMIQSMAAFRPEQMFGLYFAGIGGNFTSVGNETRNGVKATHYKGDEAIGAILGAIAGFQGTWSSDAWIANDGGFLVHSEASAEAPAGSKAGRFLIMVDITDPNSAGPIKRP